MEAFDVRLRRSVVRSRAPGLSDQHTTTPLVLVRKKSAEPSVLSLKGLLSLITFTCVFFIFSKDNDSAKSITNLRNHPATYVHRKYFVLFDLFDSDPRKTS